MGKVEHQLLLAPAAWLPCALDRRWASASVSSKAIITMLSKTRPIARMVLLPVRLFRRMLCGRKPVDRRLGYSLRTTDIHMTAATEKGISHGATATCISARPSPRHRPGPRRSQRAGAVRGGMGAPRPLQARPQPDHVRHPDSARPREATGRPPATRARQRAQTKRTERGHYPSRVLRGLAGGDDRGDRRQAGVRRPLAMARLGRSASAKPQTLFTHIAASAQVSSWHEA